MGEHIDFFRRHKKKQGTLEYHEFFYRGLKCAVILRELNHHRYYAGYVRLPLFELDIKAFWEKYRHKDPEKKFPKGRCDDVFCTFLEKDSNRWLVAGFDRHHCFSSWIQTEIESIEMLKDWVDLICRKFTSLENFGG